MRRARIEDVPGIAAVHVASAAHSYAPLAGRYAAPSVAERTEQWTQWLSAWEGRDDGADFVAESDAQIVGFVRAGATRAGAAAERELYVIHVLPEHRGSGVGSALFAAACDAVREDAPRSLTLHTYAELPCCAFYRRRGGLRHAATPADFDGAPVTELQFTWPAERGHHVRAHRLRPAIDADAEAIFAIERAGFSEHVAAVYGAWDETWQRERFMSRWDAAAHEVVELEGRTVGALSVRWDEDPVFLVSIRLAPAARGAGLGTALIEEVLGRAALDGRSVRLQVFTINEAARRLYERLGFRETASSDTHVQMLAEPAASV